MHYIEDTEHFFALLWLNLKNIGVAFIFTPCWDIFPLCLVLVWLPSLVIDPGPAPPVLSLVELHLSVDKGTIISGLISEGPCAFKHYNGPV